MGYTESSIPAIFQNRAATYAERTFIKYKEDGSYVGQSYREFESKVRRVGLGLISLGVAPGDIVAIFAQNSWQWALADLAILSVGAVDAPIYDTNSGEEAAYIINDSGARIAFASDAEHLKRMLDVIDTTPELKKIIVFEDVPASDLVMSLAQLMELGAQSADAGAFDERLKAIDPADLATLIYTSGTTGPPKGVMLTHNNFVANTLQCQATHPMVCDADEAIHILPWSHSFGRTVGFYLMMHVGAVISLAESFSTVLENFQELRPTVMVSVPRLFEKLYAGILSKVESAPAFKKRLFFWSRDVAMQAVDLKVQHKPLPLLLAMQYALAEKLVYSKLREGLGLDRIKVFINGGGPLSVDIDRYFNGVGIPLHNGYGLSETTPVTHTNTFETHIFGSVGPALKDTETMIAEDGEIFIKGPQVMKGYYNKPEATEAVFTKDGWFKTGDIGFIDEKGCLHITDRKKDIIITAGGKNIAPQNIENTLVADLFIEQAVVIGEGRKYLSALIVPNFDELSNHAAQEGLSFTSNRELIQHPEIQQFYEDRINHLMRDYARVEQIRRFKLLDHEFSQQTGELTPTLKMKRKVINQNHQDTIDSMY